MTRTVRNLSSKHPASESARCIPTAMLLALVVLGFPTRVRAADKQPRPFLFTSSTMTTNEIEIVAKVRQALRQDTQLRPLNLGVHMRGGVASLSGPVPAEELRQRAIKIVQRVDGVLAVNAKDLYISTSAQVGTPLAVIIQDERPTQTRSASAGSPTLVGGWNAPSSANGSPSTASQQITVQAPEMASPATARSSPTLAQGRVGDARLTANPHPESPAQSISVALERLRQRETRYQQIRARVQGTTVFIFPGEAASEDAMTFAQAVRRLPGVQHVILSSGPR